MQKQVPGLVAKRKSIMEKPEIWEPLISELGRMFRVPVFVKQEEVRAIPIPAPVMAGDRDEYNTLQGMRIRLICCPKANWPSFRAVGMLFSTASPISSSRS